LLIVLDNLLDWCLIDVARSLAPRYLAEQPMAFQLALDKPTNHIELSWIIDRKLLI